MSAPPRSTPREALDALVAQLLDALAAPPAPAPAPQGAPDLLTTKELTCGGWLERARR